MSEELIERFFKKQCTAEEARQVAAYLKGQPEILNEYLNETEWNDSEPGEEIPKENWDEIWNEIERKSKLQRPLVLMKQIAVAAAIAGFVFISYHLFTISTERLAEKPQFALATTEHKTEINTSAKDRQILLQDGSVITLSPASMIEYNVPFTNNKRDIYLKGEAYFKVAKDKDRPFTVYAGDLSTTALGTEFKITSHPNENKTLVKLFTGKVVIKSTKSELKGWKKNVYLLPGEQLTYNADKMVVSVRKIQNAIRPPIVIKATPASLEKNKITNADLSFSNTPLDHVLQQLSKFYNAKIVYDLRELEGMNFTGAITKKDSLPIVLKVIGQMNQLQILQQDNAFIVRKALAVEKDGYKMKEAE